LLLVSNIIYGTTEFCLPYLFYLFQNNEEKREYLCELSFYPQIIHVTNMSQLCMWVVFLRSMLIKKAESIIAIAKGDGKKEVTFISLLVALVWGTFTILHVVVLCTEPGIPQNVTAIRICKGLEPFVDENHKQKMSRNNLLRIATVLVVVFFVWTSQSRINRYRRKHNKSYFSEYRQNIATVEQTIYTSYLKCFCNLIKSCEFMTIDFFFNPNQFAFVSLALDIIGAFLDCVIFPAWWLYSIKMNFPELWESKCCEHSSCVEDEDGQVLESTTTSYKKLNLEPRRDFLKMHQNPNNSIKIKRAPKRFILPSLKLNDITIIEI